MRLYSASFAAINVTAAQDLFEVAAAANVSVRLHGFILGQSSDFGDAQAEGLGLTILTGFTTTGAGGATITATPIDGGAGASSTVKRNNTTLATGGTSAQPFADSWNVQAGYQLWLPPPFFFKLPGAGRLVLRMTAPADAITMSGTIFFEEI